MASNTAGLPLNIRRAVRDDFARKDGPISHRLAQVSGALGLNITLYPDWPRLWDALPSKVVTQDTFVRDIEQVISPLLDIFVETIEDDASDDLFEGLLADVTGNLEITVWVCVGAPLTSAMPSRDDSGSYLKSKEVLSEVHVTWTAPSAQFKLSIPPGFEKISPVKLYETLRSDFLSILYARNTGQDASTAIPHYLNSGEQPPNPTTYQQPPQVIIPVPSIPAGKPFPKIERIPRPDDILRKPPYHLTIQRGRSGEIVVECGHSDCLVLLEAYLKKFIRNNPNYGSKANMAKLRLEESAFGVNRMYNTLVIEPLQRQSTSPMMVLSFVQEVLGFSVVKCGDGGQWWYCRRDEGFT